VAEKKGMTFASGLRHVLRQDPDIIMVGEIRDQETAVMAIQSALTGHLVFSTLHTNDAPSAVTRLLDLGIEPYLAASSVIGVMAQRLVRRNCPHCSAPSELTSDMQQQLGMSEAQAAEAEVRRGTGCEHCRETGYRGRLGLFELLTVDPRLQQAVNDRATATQIKQLAVERGMRTLHHEGVRRVQRGETTPEEVLRVTMHGGQETETETEVLT
jgi:type II secretory ATPase GspE/PulE/Tfp pilus assembly ATPase PilB-like protein